MSEMRILLVDTASRLFSDLCDNDAFVQAESGGLSPALWKPIEESGLARATVTEARGGDGSDLGDALALVREAGKFCLPVPLAETLMAELLLSASALPVQAGLVTVGPVLQNDKLSLSKTIDGYELSGTLRRVPWARHAGTAVVLAQYEGKWTTVIVKKPKVSEQGMNYANEPRDTIRFDKLRIGAEAVGSPGTGFTPQELRFTGALFRLTAMAGALERVMQMSVLYAKERVQFGRPIGKFQAVQQQLAVLASQVAAASAAADSAAEAAQHGAAMFEIAAAKARSGEAAGIVAGIAHQVHGAMGFTYEHGLHRSTRRLWAWRDEFGSETEWATWVGQVAASVGGKGLWAFLTSSPKQIPSFPV